MRERRVEMIFEGFVERRREERFATVCPEKFQPDSFVAYGQAQDFMVTDIQVDREGVAGGLFPAEHLHLALPGLQSMPIAEGSTVSVAVMNTFGVQRFRAVLSGPAAD